MVRPSLGSWMKQQCDAAGFRINAGQITRFGQIAVDAGEREVVLGVGAAMFFRYDVFELQWNQWGLVLVQLAILAPMIGSFPDEAFRFGVHHAERARSFRTLAWRMAMNLLAFT